MKKIFTYFIIALAALALAVSCDKQIAPQDDTPAIPEGEQITITVAIPNGLTKVSLTQDPDNADGDIKLAWQETDKIVVIDASNPSNYSEFTINSIDSEKPYIATFTGTAVTASSYNILYGASSVAAANSENYEEQHQNGDASTAGLKFMALLSGVDSSENIEFSQAWASEHGNGTFKQSGALRFRVQLPINDCVVRSVALTASDDLFYTTNACDQKTNTIKVIFDDAVTTGEKNVITAYAMLPWCEEVEIPSGTSLTVVVEDTCAYIWKKSFTPASGMSIKAGVTNSIKMNRTGFELEWLFAGGTGYADNPWLIANVEQMKLMKTYLCSGEIKYFKLVKDIDLANEEWEPVVSGKPYDRFINFDGNYHTISNLSNNTDVDYPSLFGVFNGVAKNLTIENAAIHPKYSGAASKGGVFASYIGTPIDSFAPEVTGIIIRNCTVGAEDNRFGGYVGGLCAQVENDNTIIKNVQVIDTDIYGATTNTAAAGGVIGYLHSAAEIEKISSNSSIKSYRYVGGLIGAVTVTTENTTASITKSCFTGAAKASYRYAGGLVGVNLSEKGTINIKDCYVTGDVDAAKGWAGGVLGAHSNPSIINLENCYVTGAVTASFGAGGIVGQIGKDGFSAIRCMPFNSAIKATIDDSAQHYSSGAVVAYGKGVNVIVNWCYRISDLADHFTDCPGNSANQIEQHTFISTAATIPQRQSLTYGYYHHGRKTAMTLCDLIHSGAIGEDWSEDVWDWSGSIPTLK